MLQSNELEKAVELLGEALQTRIAAHGGTWRVLQAVLALREPLPECCWSCGSKGG